MATIQSPNGDSPPQTEVNDASSSVSLEVVADGDLLRRFHRSGDEGAFAQLVARHTPMVFSVCVSVLRNRADAEDAFQAAFFVLARRSRSIQQRQDISAWLHKVALRCALTVLRRKAPQAASLPPADELPKQELEKISTRASMTLLHEQLDLLPTRYRAPLILYHMQGATRQETRARLNLSEAALKSRLERGKRILRRRLTQAGFAALGVTVLLRTASAQAISPALQQSTVAVALQVKQAWAAAITSSAGANTAIPIAQGVQQTMMMSSLLKSAVVAVLGFGMGLAAIAPLSSAAAINGAIVQDQAAELQTPEAEPAEDVALALRSQASQLSQAGSETPADQNNQVQRWWGSEIRQPLLTDTRLQDGGGDLLYRERAEWGDSPWQRSKYRESRSHLETPLGALKTRIDQLERELELYQRLYNLEHENAQLRALLEKSDKK